MKTTRCQCGAITVETGSGDNYSMLRNDFLKLCPGRPVPKQTMSTCNYCVNHWGIGLCGCGSGEPYGKCDNELPECNRPAQDIEMGLTHCTTDGGGWGK